MKTTPPQLFISVEMGRAAWHLCEPENSEEFGIPPQSPQQLELGSGELSPHQGDAALGRRR